MRWALCVAVVLTGVQSNKTGSVAGTIVCNGAGNSCPAVIYAEKTPKPEVRPPRTPVILDQNDLTFIPHVLPVLVGTTVSFPNHDEVPHNVFSSSPAKIFNVGIYPKGSSRRVTFDNPGEVRLHCNIHPQMSAYVLVLPQPYFVTASPEGKFQLKGLPPGRYKVTIWHERYKPVSRFLEIKAAENLPFNVELRELR
ncbi:MAG TPA: plastocyanin/azurin family copper-binding protein [Candidatus Angelobacter sp.]